MAISQENNDNNKNSALINYEMMPCMRKKYSQKNSCPIQFKNENFFVEKKTPNNQYTISEIESNFRTIPNSSSNFKKDKKILSLKERHSQRIKEVQERKKQIELDEENKRLALIEKIKKKLLLPTKIINVVSFEPKNRFYSESVITHNNNKTENMTKFSVKEESINNTKKNKQSKIIMNGETKFNTKKKETLNNKSIDIQSKNRMPSEIVKEIKEKCYTKSKIIQTTNMTTSQTMLQINDASKNQSKKQQPENIEPSSLFRRSLSLANLTINLMKKSGRRNSMELIEHYKKSSDSDPNVSNNHVTLSNTTNKFDTPQEFNPFYKSHDYYLNILPDEQVRGPISDFTIRQKTSSFEKLKQKTKELFRMNDQESDSSIDLNKINGQSLYRHEINESLLNQTEDKSSKSKSSHYNEQLMKSGHKKKLLSRIKNLINSKKSNNRLDVSNEYKNDYENDEVFTYKKQDKFKNDQSTDKLLDKTMDNLSIRSILTNSPISYCSRSSSLISIDEDASEQQFYEEIMQINRSKTLRRWTVIPFGIK